MAYSQHIIQIYSFHGGDDLKHHLEVKTTSIPHSHIFNLLSIIISVLYIVNSDDFGIRNISQIDAHVGGVNDLAFSLPNKQLSVITCGDDKTIKVCLNSKIPISSCHT